MTTKSLWLRMLKISKLKLVNISYHAPFILLTDETFFKAASSSWTKYTPKNLKAPIHSALSTKKEKTKDVWAKVAEAKLLKIDLEMNGLKKQAVLDELSETKLKLEIEKVKIEIEIMQRSLKSL